MSLHALYGDNLAAARESQFKKQYESKVETIAVNQK
jgi:hypothetical protein